GSSEKGHLWGLSVRVVNPEVTLSAYRSRLSTKVGTEAGSAQSRQLPSLVGLHGGRCRWDPNINLPCMGKKSKKSVLPTEQTDTLKENLPSTRTVDVISKTVCFLVLSVPNNNLSKKSPFAIQKGLDGISKNLKSVKKLASGDLLLETGSALQSKAFLSAKTFLDLPVSITPHKTLNFCRGVVSDDEILFSSDEEILEGLSSQGVVNVRRILTRKGTATFPTKHVILTFSSTVLPSSIKAGYLNIRVRPYIPYPLRCPLRGTSSSGVTGITTPRYPSVFFSFRFCLPLSFCYFLLYLEGRRGSSP
ncbi:hypothetical protein AVEN_257167-1, partial [Araneus ventricosus]